MADQYSCPDADDPNADVAGLYPTGTVPEDRIERLSSLCSFGQTPRMITAMLRQILLQHFVDANNVRDPYLRQYLLDNGVWSADEETGLYIESLSRWRPELTEARPAVVIQGHAWRWRRVGIGNFSGERWRTGEMCYAGLWQGSHTVFAIGNEGAETQTLAAEIAKLLLNFGPLIIDQMSLHDFQVLEIGELSALKEATENYVSPVNMAYVAEEAWSLQVDAPRLKRIVFNTEDIVGY